MSNSSRKEYLYYLLIPAAAVILCFAGLGSHPIYILDEAKNSEAAREMFLSGDWLVPTFNNDLRTDKPVLHYWFMMLAYKIFGVSAFSARFFSAVFGVLTLVSSWHFVKKFTNERLALLSFLVLASSLFFIQEFHLAVPDPYLIFFISFGLFNFYDFYLNKKFRNWILFYASLGLGVLVKGPVAIALPGLAVLIFLLLKREFNLKKLKQLKPILGGLLILLISAPWFYAVHKVTDGAFTEGFFMKHNFERFTSEMEGHGGLPFVTWAFVLLGLLPFSFFIIQGFVRSWKVRKLNDFVLFSFIISVVFIGFFSISSTKLPNYPMPSYPFVAVLIAFYLKELLESKVSMKGYKISLWVWVVISLLMPVAAFIIFTKVEIQLLPVRWAAFVLIPLAIGGLTALFFYYKDNIKNSFLSLGVSSVITSVLLFALAYPALASQGPTMLAKDLIKPNTEVIVYKGFDPSFLFNFERTFEVTEDKNRVREFMGNYPDGLVITKERFLKSDWAEESPKILLNQKALFENYTLVIFKKE